MQVPFEPGTKLSQKEFDVKCFVEDYIEEHHEVPNYLEVGEIFDIRLDDLEELEHLVSKYDAFGTYTI